MQERNLSGTDGNHDVTFQYFSNDYLKLSLPRKLVFMGKKLPANAPEFFHYGGIRVYKEKNEQKGNNKWRK